MGALHISIRWQPPIDLSPDEARVAATIRAELFEEAFQAELAAAYQPRGAAPLPVALLAMVTLLQACDQVGDAGSGHDGARGPALAAGAGVSGRHRRARFAGACS